MKQGSYKDSANGNVNMDQLFSKRAKKTAAPGVEKGFIATQCSRGTHWKCFVVRCSCGCHGAMAGLRQSVDK